MQTLNGEARPEKSLAAAIAEDQYAGYAYAYPHKTSYRHLEPTVSLADAWAEEDKSNLFLYVHLPFCEMRCGFCNLFTASQPPEELVRVTLEAIRRQSKETRKAIEPESIAQIALGGGTPTYLSIAELKTVFETLHRDWPIDFGNIPVSVEVSPGTVEVDKLSVLTDHGVQRISMGVQSLVERDLSRLGRPQSLIQVERAIDLIRRSGVEVFNLDLIYGSKGQTEADWIQTLQKALSFQPEELFLYPLYVRELTGLSRRGRTAAENRRHLYRLGRSLLIEAGYRQISMRMFRREDVEYRTQHCCQEDGMIGLGPGARSYTSRLHYSSEYAVSGDGVRKIIAEYNQRPGESFANADYGVWLDENEQARRYLIRSLLQVDGLDRAAFENQFKQDVCDLLPQVLDLVSGGFTKLTAERIRLNPDGLEHSDVIGPWLYSDAVRHRMEQFDLR